MDKQIKSLREKENEAIETLSSIFPMPGTREEKCRMYFHLARSVPAGCIVELGAYHGNGTIALCKGTEAGNNVPVYSVDDYDNYTGWANEKYTIADEAYYWENLREAGVYGRLIKQKAHLAMDSVEEEVALIVWDLGINGDLTTEFKAWDDRIMVGGKYVIHDLPSGFLGYKDVVEEAEKDGRYRFWEEASNEKAGIFTLMKVSRFGDSE